MITGRLEVPRSAVPRAPLGKRTLNRIRRVLSPNRHRTHFVYIVPSDKPASAAPAIAAAAKHLQRWYRWQMGNGKTFTLTNAVVETYPTPYPASFYSTNPIGDYAGWFWRNVLYELSAQCGGGFWQEFDDWVVYIDAEPAPGQYAGGTSGGYISGVAVMGSKDIAALMGNDPDWSLCRGRGGGGHEMGHSFGLPHPPAGPDWERAIMGVGYGTYADCILTEADKIWLNNNPFFDQHPPTLFQLEPCPFDDGFGRRVPGPRPDPTPPARP